MIYSRSVALLFAKNSIYCQRIYAIGNLKNSEEIGVIAIEKSDGLISKK
jgi:hypothetical protein